MFCTKCGTELRDSDRFCCQCAQPTPLARPSVFAPQDLMLDKRNKKIAGVCAGMARYFEMDVTLMRVIWLVGAIITGGLGALAYLACWIIIPKAPEPAPLLEPQRT
jgi:phage shock protein C